MNKQQFIAVIVITFIVGMVWLISDIIFNTKPSIIISDKLEALLAPINPNFNPRVIQIIDKEVLDTQTVNENLKQPAPPLPSTNPVTSTESAQPNQ